MHTNVTPQTKASLRRYIRRHVLSSRDAEEILEEMLLQRPSREGRTKATTIELIVVAREMIRQHYRDTLP